MERKTHIKQQQNIKKIELFLKKQLENDRNIKLNGIKQNNVSRSSI